MSQIQSLGATGGTGTVNSVLAGDSTSNVAAGLEALPVGAVTTVNLTNRYRGVASTTDETPANIITIPLGATAGVYIVDVNIVAFNSSDSKGAGYHIYGAVRTDTTDSILCGTPDKWVNEESATVTGGADVVAGGVGDNNLYVQITGVALKTIEWKSVATYVLVN